MVKDGGREPLSDKLNRVTLTNVGLRLRVRRAYHYPNEAAHAEGSRVDVAAGGGLMTSK